MAKDPAFLFYSSDFLTGTMFFNDEQTGKYIRLLCAQHQKGHLTEKDMLNICKTYDEDIFSKFIKDDEGKYFNERCEIEINKRKKYSESRANNRKSAHNEEKNIKKNKKDMLNISNSYEKHMENENINENIIKKENEVNKFSFKNSLKNYGFDENLINDWLIVRKNKKASNTKTAFDKFISEVEKIEKVPINEILAHCVEKSWAGFKAEWYNNINSNQNLNGKQGINQPKQHPLTELRAAANQILSEYASQNNRTGD